MSLCFAICSLLSLCRYAAVLCFLTQRCWERVTTKNDCIKDHARRKNIYVFRPFNFVVGTQHLAWVQTITYPPLPIPSPTGVPLREKTTCTVMKNYLDSMFLNSGCSKPPPTLIKSRWRFKDYLHQHWWCLSQWKGPLLLNLKIIQINRNTLVTDIRIIP